MSPLLARIKESPQLAAWWLALLGSGVALSGALISQYGFGLHPCELCYVQRVPYALVILLATCGLWRMKKQRPMAGGMLVVLALIFAVGAGVAAYHAGIEWGIWQGVTACSGGGLEGLTPEELLQRILNAPKVSCSEAAFRVAGLSMAGWNVLYSLALALAMMHLKKRSMRHDAAT